MSTTFTTRRTAAQSPAPRTDCDICHQLLDDQMFSGALTRERKRADRSNGSLVLLRATIDPAIGRVPELEHAVIAAVTANRRETDLAGWLEWPRQIGLMVPHIDGPLMPFARDLERAVRQEIARRLDPRTLRYVVVDAFVHEPDNLRSVDTRPVDRLLSDPAAPTMYDLLKRAFDIAVALVLLTVLSPMFAVIAVLVKLNSRGPVLFRQARIGLGMKPFTMLKFRSMHVNTKQDSHVDFVTAFIKAGKKAQGTGTTGLFKIVDDPRVTSIGRILRKTSLDELPQLWNVFRGDMSLVGPRPPLSYEVEKYERWHRRRVLEAKPGITGLWQVTGRSRTTFDDMVRLDLRYAKTRSLWTDLKILLATPAAVIAGKGAV